MLLRVTRGMLSVELRMLLILLRMYMLWWLLRVLPTSSMVPIVL
jgi:hypothetical protein